MRNKSIMLFFILSHLVGVVNAESDPITDQLNASLEKLQLDRDRLASTQGYVKLTHVKTNDKLSGLLYNPVKEKFQMNLDGKLYMVDPKDVVSIVKNAGFDKEIGNRILLEGDALRQDYRRKQTASLVDYYSNLANQPQYASQKSQILSVVEKLKERYNQYDGLYKDKLAAINLAESKLDFESGLECEPIEDQTESFGGYAATGSSCTDKKAPKNGCITRGKFRCQLNKNIEVSDNTLKPTNATFDIDFACSCDSAKAGAKTCLEESKGSIKDGTLSDVMSIPDILDSLKSS